MMNHETLLKTLLCRGKDDGACNIYSMIQCEFAYHNNRMEGSRVTFEQTETLFAEQEISDGNGRIGRLLLFKECLRHGIASSPST